MIRGAALVLAGLLTSPLSALAAADAATRVATGAAGVEQTAKALEAATAQPQQVAALGKAIAAYEAAITEMRAGIGDAGTREAAILQDFADRRVEIARLLAALEAKTRTPAPTEALHPQGPLGAARAAAMMDRLDPALRTRAAGLRDQLAALAAARDIRSRGKSDVAAALPRLNAAHAALSATLASASPDELGPADPTVTILARDSASLGDFATALAKAAATSPAPSRVATTAAGPSPFTWPVAGQVVHHFDEPDAAGVRRPGIVVTAAPFTLVNAPAHAVVRYAGPFLEYGYVVVLAPDSETMLILAGLDRLQVRSGSEVQRGDLLGLLGGAPPDAEEHVITQDADSGSGVGETLYIEVRHGQGPVDPEPLFSGEDG